MTYGVVIGDSWAYSLETASSTRAYAYAKQASLDGEATVYRIVTRDGKVTRTCSCSYVRGVFVKAPPGTERSNL